LRHSIRNQRTFLVQYWREMSLTLSSYHVKIYPSFSSASPFAKTRAAVGPPQSAGFRKHEVNSELFVCQGRRLLDKHSNVTCRNPEKSGHWTNICCGCGTASHVLLPYHRARLKASPSYAKSLTELQRCVQALAAFWREQAADRRRSGAFTGSSPEPDNAPGPGSSLRQVEPFFS